MGEVHLRVGDDERLARAAWSRISEPGDPQAGTTISVLGAVGALRWLESSARHPHRLPRRQQACVERWAPRLEGLEPERDLERFAKLGGRVIVPGDPEWPGGLADLGAAVPHALWVRGAHQLPGGENARNAVAIVGSRASTRYGEGVAREFGFGLAEEGFPVISGGAYGIDAAAHRGALAASGAGTIAVLAGGADRLYPAGNEEMLRRVIEEGAIVAELGPGSAPTRHRFLARNRLIAALGTVVVVVEAGHRSGALSTANHAVEIMRTIGAVPGPITSVASGGCHRLLREQKAVCVTSTQDILELVGPIGSVEEAPEPACAPGLLDGLEPLASQVFDALPARAGAEVTSLVRTSGLSATEVLHGLATLHTLGRVRRVGERWARVTS